MQELVRTNDTVLLSWIEALLADAEIPTFMLDGHMAIVEGSIGALQKRLMVREEDEAKARAVLREAEITLPDSPFL